MPDDKEPGGWELHRSIQQLRSDSQRGFDGINGRLDSLGKQVVSSDVHASDLRDINNRIAELTKDIGDEREARLQAIAEERAAREKENAEQRATIDRIITMVRWAIAAVAVPVTLYIGDIVLSARGGG